jgi:hypothetical protein
MVKVRRADAMIVNGLELDDWADVVAQGANNQNVIPGAPGRIDASRGLAVLEVPKTRVDRSMGDVHPLGNPHYTLDPGMAPAVTRTSGRARADRAPASRRLRAKPAAVPRPLSRKPWGAGTRRSSHTGSAGGGGGHAMWVYLT